MRSRICLFVLTKALLGTQSQTQEANATFKEVEIEDAKDEIAKEAKAEAEILEAKAEILEAKAKVTKAETKVDKAETKVDEAEKNFKENPIKQNRKTLKSANEALKTANETLKRREEFYFTLCRAYGIRFLIVFFPLLFNFSVLCVTSNKWFCGCNAPRPAITTTPSTTGYYTYLILHLQLAVPLNT